MLLLGTMSVAIAAPVATPPAPRLAEPQAKSLANEVAEVGTALVATGQVPALAIAMVTSDEILLAEAFGETAVGSGTGAD
ncbi:MAG: hypothetical protein KDI56_02130, partial [Xanthomonadales bacterium]|nr:hypothetical protein [Xanthomonadales bacterium]